MRKGSSLNRICTVDGCEKKHAAKGYCKIHWGRMRRNGNTEKVYKKWDTCQRKGCERSYYSKGLCKPCYIKKKKHEAGLKITQYNIDKFHQGYTLIPETTCWIWEGPVIGSMEYGQIQIGYNYMRAHRLSWIIFNGPILEGMCVLHKCDVPLCVNPDHLWLGTYKDNADDCAKKGRAFWQK